MSENKAFVTENTDDIRILTYFLRNNDLAGFTSAISTLDLRFLNHATFEGFTILQHAVLYGYHEFVDSLLAININPNVGNGYTRPVLLAASCGYWKILKSLKEIRYQRDCKLLIRFDVWTEPEGENVLHLGKKIYSSRQYSIGL